MSIFNTGQNMNIKLIHIGIRDVRYSCSVALSIMETRFQTTNFSFRYFEYSNSMIMDDSNNNNNNKKNNYINSIQPFIKSFFFHAINMQLPLCWVYISCTTVEASSTTGLLRNKVVSTTQNSAKYTGLSTRWCSFALTPLLVRW